MISGGGSVECCGASCVTKREEFAHTAAKAASIFSPPLQQSSSSSPSSSSSIPTAANLEEQLEPVNKCAKSIDGSEEQQRRVDDNCDNSPSPIEASANVNSCHLNPSSEQPRQQQQEDVRNCQMEATNHQQSSSQPSSNNEIDEGLYSRQLYVLGADAMKKMADCRVLISGINGVGLEVAKCSILGGLKSVTLHDVRDVTNKDLSSVYYASRSDIGHNRAKVVHSKLAELNSYVEVNVLEKELSREILKSFDIVVLCGEDLREVKPQVADCEALGLKYVLALSHGVFGCLFNNFGKGFYVHDQDGNEPIQSYIETLYADADAKMITVTTMEDKPHQLANNSLVRFEEIAGLPELNDQSKSFEITYISPHSFSFHYDNITATESHTGHGIVIEIKGGTTIDFKPMNLCFNDEDIMISDFGKISHPKQIVSLYALTADPQFSAQSNQQSSTDVARQCESFMQSEFSAEVEIDEKLAKSFVSQHNKGQLAPLAAIIGSLTASEVMKAATGKFTPIDQWFAFDAVECIHPELDQESQIDNEQTPSLEKQILGQKTGEYLENARLFMVGAGAIGCELIKLFALMNVATKQSSFLKVTDMDTIEKSNLNRQFLFRPRDVGSFKSEVACLAAKQINPSFNILPLTDQINSQADCKYNVQFYRELHLIVNALDNMETRLFMDSKCLVHGLPLLESATLGTKGNTQVVVPNLTESFGSSQDAPEEQFALCTIKNFPYLIEHTIHWSREFLESKFVLPSQTLSKFFSTQHISDEFIDNLNEESEVDHLCQMVAKHPLRSYADCISRSLDLMVEEFVHNILQITASFPKDHLTVSGSKFWTGLKRYPQPLAIDLAHDQDQFDFVEAAAFQLAKIYGLTPIPSNHKQLILQTSIQYNPPKFVANKSAKIAENDEELNKQSTSAMAASKHTSGDISAAVAYHLANVDTTSSENASSTNLHKNCEALEFEKDDDSNLQIQLIAAASNLRAKNYQIKPVSRIETKRIAGKIIPAINTTTALVAGLIALEFYKLSRISGHKLPAAAATESGAKCPVPIEIFRNSYLNLSLPFITQSEPMPLKSQVYKDQELQEHSFNLWDFLELHAGGNKQFTLAQFLQKFCAEFKLNLTMLSCGESLLYADFYPNLSSEEHMNTSLVLLIEKAQKMELESSAGQSFVILEGMMEEVDDSEYDIPSIKFYYCK